MFFLFFAHSAPSQFYLLSGCSISDVKNNLILVAVSWLFFLEIVFILLSKMLFFWFFFDCDFRFILYSLDCKATIAVIASALSSQNNYISDGATRFWLIGRKFAFKRIAITSFSLY